MAYFSVKIQSAKGNIDHVLMCIMMSRTILNFFYAKHGSKKKTSSREIARSWRPAKVVMLTNFANVIVRQSGKNGGF